MRPEDVEGLTVGGLLDLVTERRPEDDALVYVDRGLRYSYAEFNEVVQHCARALMALGLEKGDHVAVWGQNVPQWVTLQFATGKIGAVLVTVNPAYKANELEYVLKQRNDVLGPVESQLRQCGRVHISNEALLSGHALEVSVVKYHQPTIRGHVQI